MSKRNNIYIYIYVIINITEPDMHIYIVGNLEYSTDREESKNLNYLGHTRVGPFIIRC